MHKFKAGERVLYRPASPWERGSSAEIIRPLPVDGTVAFYRVRSEAEQFERVVPEERLAPLPH
ncbi:hypothetical protein [Prosthecomicrobium sp. N25]|uniref:hypothetical protein n=1 Tax=Prosthecomicrobium sp. N25 TaxID=3129254 RepID=UPI0030768994